MVSTGRAKARKHKPAEPITDVLGKICQQLQDIADRIDRNQALIAKATWHQGAGDVDYLQAMQDADLNAQRVAGLAGYLEAIAASSNPQWQVNTKSAMAALTLSDLAQTMREQAPIQAQNESKGDVDLF